MLELVDITRQKCTIIAPHGDDEIIGCYEVLTTCKNVEVIYLEPPQLEKDPPWIYSIISLSALETSLDCSRIILSPHYVYEMHPLHRGVGCLVNYLRQTIGLIVVWYSTTMNAPFVRLSKNPQEKLAMLNTYYSAKADLWKYEHKYFLYEGYLTYL